MGRFLATNVSLILRGFPRHYCVGQASKTNLSQLRKRTGVPLKNCRAALQKCHNNLEEAEKWLKEQAQKEGWARADKLQSRPMSQGLLGLIQSRTGATMIESHDQLLIECDEFPTLPVASEETVQTICETLDTVVQPCLPDHQYSLTTVNENQYSPETVDRGKQTDIGMPEMVKFMELKKSENPDAIMRDLFIEKVTASDKSVKKYTGVPSKSMLNGLYEIFNEASHINWSGQGSAQQVLYQENMKLSKYEEFIITLIRLCLAVFTFFLADLFGVSNARVSQNFYNKDKFYVPCFNTPFSLAIYTCD